MIDDATHTFVDTNIFVYAHDISAGSKRKQAQTIVRDLWESGRGCLSVQVVQEFYVTITRKVLRPLSSQQALNIINDLSVWRIHAPNVTDVQRAIAIQTKYGVSFWEAMILQSAVHLGCNRVWSEDLNSGQTYNGVLVENPFGA